MSLLQYLSLAASAVAASAGATGDTALPAFDNATEALLDLAAEAGDLFENSSQLLSASSEPVLSGANVSRPLLAVSDAAHSEEESAAASGKLGDRSIGNFSSSGATQTEGREQGQVEVRLNTSQENALASSRFGFEYHKEPFPLDWRHDGLTVLFASIGLIIAASGGIGGGGILVPLFMLALEFKPKHAIALSNFTILGGAIANTVANARKRHPHLDQPLIDWDLILAMEPLTIFGAVFGSLLSKILPNFILTVLLVLILAFMGQRTLKKGLTMFQEESRTLRRAASSEQLELSVRPTEVLTDRAEYLELNSDSEAASGQAQSSMLCCKISTLTVCFVGTCVFTVLKGGGNFPSPMGFECGSYGFWVLYFGSAPWVLLFAVIFRYQLVSEYQRKVRQGYRFTQGEVQWDSKNTIIYPLLCAISGLLAGLFGVGGGIVKGPLMLEMGIMPSVASASAAAMILYTSAAASTSYIVFGLLHPVYGFLFFSLGLVCTSVGQYVVGQWVKKHNRQSPIVLSIGLVIVLSSFFVAVNTVVANVGRSFEDIFAFHGVCDASA
eukprot:TRINITY_DN13850_c0_g1_i5.p1 TRINITY_DN13850_c0_g1~~TRINITY_DN13850_c0_g1_i5.p1  ORF type:complete len:562 (-),score=104.99 TRINITY_DN13850_c0_g1_i5:52-1716(-)